MTAQRGEPAQGHFERPHITRVDLFGGSHYAFCRSSCGWTGPWRRWRWRAARDGRKHVGASS